MRMKEFVVEFRMRMREQVCRSDLLVDVELCQMRILLGDPSSVIEASFTAPSYP